MWFPHRVQSGEQLRNSQIHVCFLKGLLGFTYHSLASKRGNGKKYETFVPRTTVGLQCKLFQSLDRRETIIVFRLNGHQTTLEFRIQQ